MAPWAEWEQPSSKTRFDIINDIIDVLKTELTLIDVALKSELDMLFYSDLDRELIAAVFYKERLEALANSSRAQIRRLQAGQCPLNYNYSPEYNHWNPKRKKYNHEGYSNEYMYNQPRTTSDLKRKQYTQFYKKPIPVKSIKPNESSRNTIVQKSSALVKSISAATTNNITATKRSYPLAMAATTSKVNFSTATARIATSQINQMAKNNASLACARNPLMSFTQYSTACAGMAPVFVKKPTTTQAAGIVANATGAEVISKNSVAKATNTVARAADTVAKATGSVVKPTNAVAKPTDIVAKASGIVAKATSSVAKATDTAAKQTDTVAKAKGIATKATDAIAKALIAKTTVPVSKQNAFEALLTAVKCEPVELNMSGPQVKLSILKKESTSKRTLPVDGPVKLENCTFSPIRKVSSFLSGNLNCTDNVRIKTELFNEDDLMVDDLADHI